MNRLKNIFILFLLLNISTAFAAQSSNKKNKMKLVPEEYYQNLKSINMKTGEPIFEGSIRPEDLKDFDSYFLKYRHFIGNQEIKSAFSYKFYKKYRNTFKKVNHFYFDRDSKNKVILKKAMWYNEKGKISQFNRYNLSSNKLETKDEFIYFNDFGVRIRKVTFIYNRDTGKLIKKISATSFTPEEQILGKIEYE